MKVVVGATSFGKVDQWGEIARAAVPVGEGGSLLVEYSAYASCAGEGPTCPLRVLVNNTEVARANTFDDVESHPGRPEFRAFTTPVGPLDAGTYAVVVEIFTSNGTGIGLDHSLLKITSL